MNPFDLDSPLVTPAWLAEHLGQPGLRVIDLRGYVKPATEPPPHYFNKRADYLQAHIPGATFVDWVHAITDPADPRHAQVAPPERFAEVMRANGVNDDTLVVTYDDGNGMFAARLWWMLNYYGHPRVAVLNGGWGRWLAAGLPTSAEVPVPPRGDFTPRPNPAWRRTADQVRAAIGTETTLVDVRTPEEYRGEASRAARAGHIPGAVNRRRDVLSEPDGALKSPDELRAAFTAGGLTDADAPETVFYCNAGVSASVSLLAHRAAGFTNGTLFDGSWKAWASEEDAPIHTGDQP